MNCIIFLVGTWFGAAVGVGMMCLLQANQWNNDFEIVASQLEIANSAFI